MILINNELIKDNTRHRFAILSKLDIVNNILISHHDISKSQDTYQIKSHFFTLPFINYIYRILEKKFCTDIITNILIYCAKKNTYQVRYYNINNITELNLFMNSNIRKNILQTFYLTTTTINTSTLSSIMCSYIYKYRIHMDIIHLKITEFLTKLLNKSNNFSIDKIMDFNKKDFSIFESLINN